MLWKSYGHKSYTLRKTLKKSCVGGGHIKTKIFLSLIPKPWNQHLSFILIIIIIIIIIIIQNKEGFIKKFDLYIFRILL